MNDQHRPFDSQSGQPGQPAQPQQFVTNDSGWSYPYVDGVQATPTPAPGQPGAPAHAVPHEAYQAQPAHAPQPAQVPPQAPGAALAAVPAPAPHVAPRRDPQRTALAAVIAFVALLLGMWAILGYMDETARTLGNIDAANAKLQAQLADANAGLVDLDRKTAKVAPMAARSTELRGLLEGIDRDMGGMLDGVAGIDAQMQALDSSLVKLDRELAEVNEVDAAMAKDLAAINDGLAGQRTQVAAMRADVDGTAAAVRLLPPRLRATNARLAHVNGVTCYMGRNGIDNNLNARFTLFGIHNGTATINATMVPAGAWC